MGCPEWHRWYPFCTYNLTVFAQMGKRKIWDDLARIRDNTEEIRDRFLRLLRKISSKTLEFCRSRLVFPRYHAQFLVLEKYNRFSEFSRKSRTEEGWPQWFEGLPHATGTGLEIIWFVCARDYLVLRRARGRNSFLVFIIVLFPIALVVLPFFVLVILIVLPFGLAQRPLRSVPEPVVPSIF